MRNSLSASVLSALVALALLVSIVTSYVVTTHLHQDTRIIKPEQFLGRQDQADRFIKRLFPIGTDVMLFTIVMDQSGLVGRDFNLHTAKSTEMNLTAPSALGLRAYSFIADCPDSGRVFFIGHPLCEVRFSAEYDADSAIVAVYAAVLNHSF